MSLRPLWLTENYPPDRGGMAQSCDRIVHALRARGVEVDVAHVSRRYDEWCVETKAGGRQICCPADDDPAHTLNRLWNVLRRELAPSHVVAFGGTLPLLAAPAYAAWLQVPLVTLIRGNDFDAAVFSPKKSDVLRHAIRSSAAVCTVTRDHAARIAAMEPGVEPAWIPNGIDAATWQLLPHDRAESAQFRVEGRRVLGMFGQLKQKKGVRFFLDALERSGVAERFHLLAVGDVDPMCVAAAASAAADDSRSGCRYTLFPFRDRLDLLPLYAACDLVVVPSFYDGLPNVVLEAAALGIPLLTSNAGGMADLLVDGENAIVFDAGDAHDCRRAITTAAAIDDAELRELGARAQRAVIEHFNVEREAQRYVEILRTCSVDRRAGAADRRQHDGR
jgi:glycosyltransferase involved in cell wall biosynthesis